MMDEELVFQLPHLLTADGALATLEAMAGSLRIDVHEQRLQGHLQSILAERQKGTLSLKPRSDRSQVSTLIKAAHEMQQKGCTTLDIQQQKLYQMTAQAQGRPCGQHTLFMCCCYVQATTMMH